MTDSPNTLLASLTSGDQEVMRGLLKPVYLEQKTVLYEVGGTVDAVYFPTGAVVSLVVSLSSGEMVEAAMVGRDGAVGLAAALDGKISLNQAIIQLGGSALHCLPGALKAAAFQSSTLLSMLIRHEQTLYAQAQQSTACMASHNVEARLCRWMLRARDLAASDTLPFTQQFLGEMLGVQRSSVTVVAHTLQKAGMIKYSRGKIQILDVGAMKDTACECYDTVNGFYAMLVGNPPKPPSAALAVKQSV